MALKPKQFASLCPIRYSTKNKKIYISTKCRACGKIKISKYVNNFFNTNPIKEILTKNLNLTYFEGEGRRR